MRIPALLLIALGFASAELGWQSDLLTQPVAAATVRDSAPGDSAFASSDPPSPGSAADPAGGNWRLVGVQGPPPSVRLVPAAGLTPAAAPADELDRSRATALGSSGGEAIPAGPEPATTRAAAAPLPVRSVAASGGDPTAAELPADAQAVKPAAAPVPYLLTPSLGGALPTGYAGSFGDYYFAMSAGTPGNLRGGSPDASINMGFGLGDPVRYLGMSVNWGIGSVKRFNGNGSLGFAVGRILLNRPTLQIAAAGGLLDAYTYGFEAGKPHVNGYGALSVTVPLRPGDPVFPQRLQFTAGAGGNSFSAVNADFITSATGYFGSIGVEVTPYLGLSMGQSSRGTNVNVSLVPFRSLPIFVNLIGADLFANTPFGTVGVLSIGWGDNLRRGFITR